MPSFTMNEIVTRTAHAGSPAANQLAPPDYTAHEALATGIGELAPGLVASAAGQD